MTDAARYVAEQLERLLVPDSRYRVGALFLTYDNGDPVGCQVPHGIAVSPHAPVEAAAVDLIQMVKALRHAADVLEQKLKAVPS